MSKVPANSLISEKIRKGSNCIINCERVQVPVQCFSSHYTLLIPINMINTFRDMLRTNKNAILGKGNNSKITCDRATILAFTQPLIALYQCIKFHLIIFSTLRDMLWTSLLSQQEHLKQGNIHPFTNF